MWVRGHRHVCMSEVNSGYLPYHWASSPRVWQDELANMLPCTGVPGICPYLLTRMFSSGLCASMTGTVLTECPLLSSLVFFPFKVMSLWIFCDLHPRSFKLTVSLTDDICCLPSGSLPLLNRGTAPMFKCSFPLHSEFFSTPIQIIASLLTTAWTLNPDVWGKKQQLHLHAALSRTAAQQASLLPQQCVSNNWPPDGDTEIHTFLIS